MVHITHGVARFIDLVRLQIGGAYGDFLKLEFARDDVLYLPVNQLDMLQKYFSPEGTSPKLSHMGGKQFEAVKARIKENVKNVAKDLLLIYAEREIREGHIFQEDSPWQKEFEEAFPYDETPDQKKAADEVKSDMQSIKPMDRLICGDAGYGKTEVALRAAFKCATESKQVAVLVPTTILAEQHYTTFHERFSAYPVKVEILSRFKNKKEHKKIVERLKEGDVDVIIGTHRLLQKDIEFKDLGLLIIDEEQHFGVMHKEKLKELKKNVDAITLTATPIPRTFQMSLFGIKDLSLINTAPSERLAVKTFLYEFDETVIKNAILKELERNGQVFFVHNRVNGIEKIKALITKLVPWGRVEVAHGQMDEHMLGNIMFAFYNGEIDILISTTIIESGLDVPRANTIIVNNANMFGLAQLYQIRGRVGRSHLQSYAYFLYDRQKLNEKAFLKLDTLKEFSQLGSGFQLALRDLEIRGAGNILGVQQHGYVVSTGFTMYCQLLKEAVEELKGRPVEERFNPKIELPVEAYLSDDYIGSEEEKMSLYKQLADIANEGKLKDFKNKITDRFGKIPKETENLFKIIELKIFCIENKIMQISSTKGNIVIIAPLIDEIDEKKKIHIQEKFNIETEFNNNTKEVIIKNLIGQQDYLDKLVNISEYLWSE